MFQSEGEDELKKRQLMELAIINGTYRDSSSKNSSREYLLCHECVTGVTTVTQMSHSQTPCLRSINQLS